MRAYVLAIVGVVIFAITFPMTRLAVGTVDAPQLSPWFSALGRAAVAGILSLFYLAYTGRKDFYKLSPNGRFWPERSDWKPLALTSLCIVFGFPILTTWALRHVESIHASVLYGFLPLMTAMLGAWLTKQRPSNGFWFCAALGSALVVAYAVIQNDSTWVVHPADVLLFLAMVFAAYGYAKGAEVTARMGAQRVICWALVISLPITLPAALVFWPAHAIATTAWMGFVYISVFSMWLGFFAWYRALALGGTVRISQIQLIQPFLSMAFSVPLLGERLDLMTLGFAVAVIATVFIGKKL